MMKHLWHIHTKNNQSNQLRIAFSPNDQQANYDAWMDVITLNKNKSKTHQSPFCDLMKFLDVSKKLDDLD